MHYSNQQRFVNMKEKRSDESWEKMLAIVSTVATTIAAENEKSRQAEKEESELRWERMGAMFATAATSIATAVSTIYAAQNSNPEANVARWTDTNKGNESSTNNTPNKLSRRYLILKIVDLNSKFLH
jgi:hypothetical protein